MRWRPLVLTVIVGGLLLLELTPLASGSVAAILPITISTLLAWVCVIAVRLGVSTMDAALVMTFADLPIIAAWAIASPATGERISALLVTVVIAAWLFGSMVTALFGCGAIVSVLLVWYVDGPWADTPLPDALWIVLAGAALSMVVAFEIERTIIGALRQMRATQDEQQALSGMRQRLAADVSHELRTPLTSINGFIDTLLREDIEVDSPLAHRLLEQARLGGARLEQLIENLLDTERATLGSLPLEIGEHRLGAMMEAAIGAATPTDRVIEVVFDRTVNATAPIQVDARRFIQILRDLITNAVEHGEGTIQVRCERRRNQLIVDVSDAGPGVPPEQVPHIFEPFTSFGEHVGATGIGLSVARSLATAHGGRLDYFGRAGDNPHIFRLRIPCWSVIPGAATERS